MISAVCESVHRMRTASIRLLSWLSFALELGVKWLARRWRGGGTAHTQQLSVWIPTNESAAAEWRRQRTRQRAITTRSSYSWRHSSCRQHPIHAFHRRLPADTCASVRPCQLVRVSQFASLTHPASKKSRPTPILSAGCAAKCLSYFLGRLFFFAANSFLRYRLVSAR